MHRLLSTFMLLSLFTLGASFEKAMAWKDPKLAGKLVSEHTPQGIRKYHYDEIGRVAWAVEPDGNRLDYFYDASGRCTQIRGRFHMLSFSYEPDGRVSVYKSGNGITQFAHDDAGRRIATYHGNGLVTHVQYNGLDRVVYMETIDPDNRVLQSFEYGLDSRGNRIQVEEHDGRVTRYGFDALSRLVEEEVTEADGQVHHWQYTYDTAHNRLSMTHNGVVTAYEYDENDRMLRAGTVTFRYDEKGQTLAIDRDGSLTRFAYNWDGMLVKVTHPDGSLSQYGYDALGLRVTATANGTGKRHFLVDANRRFPEVVEELDGQGRFLTYYAHGLDFDPPISMKRDGLSYEYLTDAHGNVTALTDPAGRIVAEYRYDAFGNLLREMDSVDNTYRYAAEMVDPETGFYYLRARYYMPEFGRFLTRDDWQGRTADPRTLNPYIYAHNNPVMGVDPTGRSTLSEALTALNIVTTLQDGVFYAVNLATGNYAVVAGRAAEDLALSVLGGPLGRMAGGSRKVMAKLGGLLKRQHPKRLKLGLDPSSKVLRENLEAVGIRPPPDAAAHHIVPGRLSPPAKRLLEKFDIDINSPLNGVYLPRVDNDVTLGTLHKGGHSQDYVKEIERRISSAAENGREGILQVLGKLKLELLTGQLRIHR